MISLTYLPSVYIFACFIAFFFFGLNSVVLNVVCLFVCLLLFSQLLLSLFMKSVDKCNMNTIQLSIIFTVYTVHLLHQLV